MPTRAVQNLEYMEGEDSSVSFESPIVDLEYPQRAINYHIKWDAGVRGKFSWKAAIFPDLWVSLVACEEVTYTVDGSLDHDIISLPNNWLNSGKLKFIWEPDVGGSTGSIDVAIRIAVT